MTRFWRLCRFRDPADAFSGEGSRRHAARWHPEGVPVIYVSSSLALAALETLVHAEVHHLKRLRYYGFVVDVPDDLVEKPAPASLPADWNHPTKSLNARVFGATWAASRRSLALVLPSVVVPQERNALLNPMHPTFATLAISGPVPYAFDPRLVKTVPRRKVRPRRRR